MFVCGKGSLDSHDNIKTTSKISRLRSELRRLKRYDMLHVLDEQNKMKGIRRVLELHGRHYMQLRLNRAEAANNHELTFKLCFSTAEEVRKYQKLLLAAILFAEDIILFHSLNQHFKTVQRIVFDQTSTKSVRYEPIGSHFEVCREMTVHYVENVTESLMWQVEEDETFKLELLRFNNCNLGESHVYTMQQLLTHVKRVDLTGNEMMPPKALHVISNHMLKSKTSALKMLNLSSCQLTDNHLVALQPALHLVEHLDLSYNEEITPLSMKIISSSVNVTILSGSEKPCLRKLNLSGCNLSDDHVKLLYQCINVFEYLDLSANIKLTAEAMNVISDAVTGAEDKNEILHILRLENCEISDKHIAALAPCIGLLRELDLSWNIISVPCIQTLTSAIKTAVSTNKDQFSLRSLGLTGCDLTDDHVEVVAECVTYLEELNLSYNKNTTSKSLGSITTYLDPEENSTESCSLRSLNISGFKIADTALQALLSAGVESLTSINLSSCNLQDSHLQQTVDSCSYLENVDLSDNPNLSPDAFRLFCEAIIDAKDSNKVFALKILNLKKCHLLDEHIQNLQPCIKYLDQLDISFNPQLSPNAMKLISQSLKDDEQQCLKEFSLASCGFKDSHLVNVVDCFVNLERVNINANNFTFISLLAIKDEVTTCKKKNKSLKLKELSVFQAFDLRDYHYTKFEIDLKVFGVQVLNTM